MTKNRKTGSSYRKVFLRHPAETDFDELNERYRNSRRHLAGLAAGNYNRDKFDQMLLAATSETNKYFVICRSDDDAIVGLINLTQIFRRVFQNAYLGYQLFAGFTGHGYMTQAVDLVLHFAFRKLKLHRVEANVQPHNDASIRILKRNGFRQEGFSRKYLKISGRWCDHERWAIIREDWKPLKLNDRNGSKK